MCPEQADRKISIIDFKEVKVAVLEHRGDPRLIGNSLQRFIAWRKQHLMPPSVSATFNIIYDDPAAVSPEDYRLDLCAATDRDVDGNHYGVVGKTIPAGRCAVLRHIGKDDTLGESISYLCSEWFPSSGEHQRDFPVFLQLVSFFPEVPEQQAVTDIFLPLSP